MWVFSILDICKERLAQLPSSCPSGLESRFKPAFPILLLHEVLSIFLPPFLHSFLSSFLSPLLALPGSHCSPWLLGPPLILVSTQVQASAGVGSSGTADTVVFPGCYIRILFVWIFIEIIIDSCALTRNCTKKSIPCTLYPINPSARILQN